MFYAVISTLFGSIATIFWKKSLSYNVPKELFNLLAKSSIFLVSFVLYLFGLLDFSGVTLLYILLLIVLTVVGTLKTIMNQHIYSIEKISTLMPYTNINKILSIILGFFIFGDISTKSLIITLIAIIIIALFSIDYKFFKIPKSIGLFTLGEIVQSVVTLLTGYILLQITGSAFFVITYIIGITYIGSIVLYKGQFKKIKKYPIKFYTYRLSACHLGGVGYLLSVIVIKELGVSISILLSFLGIGMTLLFSYILLKDKPSKKNILLTIVVSALVGIGYILK